MGSIELPILPNVKQELRNILQEEVTNEGGDGYCEWQEGCDTCPIAIDECPWCWYQASSQLIADNLRAENA